MKYREGKPIEVTIAEITPEGKVINERPARSFHAAMINVFEYILNGSGNLSTTPDIGNVARGLRLASSSYPSMGTIAAAADTTRGIVIGTDSTAIDKLGYALGALIPHATVNYGAMSQGTSSNNATDRFLDITRGFTNVSGGDVTVEEVGLYLDWKREPDGLDATWMLDRTLYNKVLAASESMTLRYRVTTET